MDELIHFEINVIRLQVDYESEVKRLKIQNEVESEKLRQLEMDRVSLYPQLRYFRI